MNSKEFFNDTFIKFLDDPRYSWQFKDCFEAWVPIGWIGLVEELLIKVNELVPEDYHDHFTWRQFKQKFGGLRAYYHFQIGNDIEDEITVTVTEGERELDNKLFKLIDEYENKSCDICEVCSSPGKVITINRYVTTRCDEHNKVV